MAVMCTRLTMRFTCSGVKDDGGGTLELEETGCCGGVEGLPLAMSKTHEFEADCVWLLNVLRLRSRQFDAYT